MSSSRSLGLRSTRLLIDQTQSPHFRGYSTFKTETTFGKADLRDQVSSQPESGVVA